MSYNHISLEPVNRSPTNTYGFSQNNNVIQFALPSTNQFLIGDSVKVIFNFQILLSNGNVLNANDVAYPSTHSGLNLFSSVNIGSYEQGGVQIETINQYPRMVSGLLNNGFASAENVVGKLSNAGCSYNVAYAKENVGTKNINASYHTKIYSGFLLGNTINLNNVSAGGCGGLTISLSCCSDNFLLAADPNNPANTGMTYRLQNVVLRCTTITPSPQESMAGKLKSNFASNYMKAVNQTENRRVNQSEIDEAFDRQVELAQSVAPPPITYNTINGFLSVLNTNNNSITSNINLGNCISMYMNFINSANLNSYTADSGATYFMETSNGFAKPLENVRISKGGILSPLNYDLETSVGLNYITNFTQTNDLRSEVYRNGAEGSYPYNMPNQDQKVGGSLYYGLKNLSLYRHSSPLDYVYPRNSVVGCRFSTIEGNGENYIDKPLQINLDSKLLTGTGNNVSTTAFLYVVNRQALVFEGGSMRVVS